MRVTILKMPDLSERKLRWDGKRISFVDGKGLVASASARKFCKGYWYDRLNQSWWVPVVHSIE